jgi:hypothetical protein
MFSLPGAAAACKREPIAEQMAEESLLAAPRRGIAVEL